MSLSEGEQTVKDLGWSYNILPEWPWLRNEVS